MLREVEIRERAGRCTKVIHFDSEALQHRSYKLLGREAGIKELPHKGRFLRESRLCCRFRPSPFD